MSLINSLRTADTRTGNGAVTNSTSLSACVDLFFLAGASRGMDEKEMLRIFTKAFVEDPLIAMRILFWSRDVRGGAGERRFFQTVISHLEKECPQVLEHNLHLIPEYGYWKDFWAAGLSFDSYKELIKDGLENQNGLLAKWLPRQKGIAKDLREYLGLTPKAYRKLVVELSNTVEQTMSEGNFDEIEYDKIPSKAFNKYRKAFERNDPQRFKAFIEAVEKGDKKINASAVFPYEIYRSLKAGNTSASIDAQWSQLPNYLEDADERMIPVCDVSGSMFGFGYYGYGSQSNAKSSLKPIDISVSLGLYLSERNKGPFKDAFFTFESRPKLQVLKGTFSQRVQQLERASWGGSTNVVAVFEKILEVAKRDSLPQSDLPTKVIIISDMEFNHCTDIGGRGSVAPYKRIIQEFESAGYEAPGLIFWNANGREGNVPVQGNTPNTALVSGASPAVVSNVLGGQDMTPYGVMMRTVDSERYSDVTLPQV